MLDPRLYILGALALLSLVSVSYLVVAAVQHVARLVRARRTASKVAVPLEERIDVAPEPVVPLGPPPVLESDPFRNGTPSSVEPPDGQAPAAPAPAPPPPPAETAAQAAPPVEPAAQVLPAASGSPEGVERLSEPLSTDQTERIAALLASLEQQAEAEAIAAEPTPAMESASVQEETVSAPPPMEPAAPAEPAVETPVEEAFSAPLAEPAVPEPAPRPVMPQPAAEPVAQPGVQPPLQPAAEPVPEVAEYRLVAPVELHFTDGSSRVGVRPGTRTHDEFQRLANTLLGELRRARSGFEQ